MSREHLRSRLLWDIDNRLRGGSFQNPNEIDKRILLALRDIYAEDDELMDRIGARIVLSSYWPQEIVG